MKLSHIKAQFEENWEIYADLILIVLTGLTLLVGVIFRVSWAQALLGTLSILGLIPVVISAVQALVRRSLSVDLLASVALIFSLLAREWQSAAFITLMLAFARVFDHVTEARAKKTIQSLMKYHVEVVRLKVGETVKDVHISAVKPGDLVIVESGERVPVDGIVISGSANIDESALTGESELVAKKRGDLVYTSTINDNGSLIVRTKRVGEDTTLSHIIKLVDDASREKSPVERTADRFTQWYIVLAMIASATMAFFHIPLREILAILLVVCADDIAVAIPLSFTIAVNLAARNGVIVKGAPALEQLSRAKYILTDKTGTITRGKPAIVDVKSYENWALSDVVTRFVSGAAESGHAVSRAISDYAEKNHVKVHLADEFHEVPGEGIDFKHDGENLLMGRLTFLEKNGCRIPPQLRIDIAKEKEFGRGISCLAVNGVAVGLLSYRDELRPHAREIIALTKEKGISEWHMLTGDNARAAALVARDLGLRHYHADMTPEGKVEFVRKFKKEHSGEGKVIFIGDGVNDAASLSLADVSIAMGGSGTDAAIEASDITIMKDKLIMVPEILGIAKRTVSVMKVNFWIWGITNVIGLALVATGLIGPAGAATYNFLTDFIPIANSFRAGRK